MPRVLAVIIVVTFAFAIIFGLGWMMSQQASQLAGDLPRYQHVLAEKIATLRKSAASSSTLEKAAGALKGIEDELNQSSAPPAPSAAPGPSLEDKNPTKPIPVQITKPEPRAFEILQSVLGKVLPPLATAGIVILFVIFILLQREDLRDRLVRLMGASDMQRATATMNDAATRLSGYFLRQVLINSAYGVFIALGLWAIGIPSPMVWGILAMLMRFVPYVGPFIAAAPPVLLGAVVDPGWTMMLLTGGLFLGSELIMGQVVEPLVYGHGTGLSPIAVILSTVFWTWLWGPLGLLLAMPLTVCLVVLGRHVEGLNFLEVLLGDKPALTPAQSFYQRALIGDSAEATYQAELCLKEGRPLVDYLDEVALGGLKLAERDAERGSLDAENLEAIDATVDEMMDNLTDFEPRRWFRKVRTRGRGRGSSGRIGVARQISRRRKSTSFPCSRARLLRAGRRRMRCFASADARRWTRPPAHARRSPATAGPQGPLPSERCHFRRPHRLARSLKDEARLPLLFRRERERGPCPLSRAPVAPHPAAGRHRPGRLLG